jgi:hypothetical protein
VDCWHDFLNYVRSAPQKCRPKKDSKNSKGNSAVGKEIGILYGSYLILNTIIGQFEFEFWLP